MNAVHGPKVKAWWFNPRTGKADAIGEFDAKGDRRFNHARTRRGVGLDPRPRRCIEELSAAGRVAEIVEFYFRIAGSALSGTRNRSASGRRLAFLKASPIEALDG